MDELKRTIEALVKTIECGKMVTVIDQRELRLCLAHDGSWHVLFRGVDTKEKNALETLLFTYVLIAEKVVPAPEDPDISIFAERISIYVRENQVLLVNELNDILKRLAPPQLN